MTFEDAVRRYVKAVDAWIDETTPGYDSWRVFQAIGLELKEARKVLEAWNI